MNWKLPRRQFLATAGTAAAATLVGESVFPLKSTLAATPLVRRDVGNMNADDPVLVAYRKAIKAMQALPNNNPLSWAYQGAIHWTTLPGPLLTSWDNCEHRQISSGRGIACTCIGLSASFASFPESRAGRCRTGIGRRAPNCSFPRHFETRRASFTP